MSIDKHLEVLVAVRYIKVQKRFLRTLRWTDNDQLEIDFKEGSTETAEKLRV